MPINDPSCATLPPLEIRRPEKVVTTKGGGYTTQLLLLDIFESSKNCPPLVVVVFESRVESSNRITVSSVVIFDLGNIKYLSHII